MSSTLSLHSLWDSRFEDCNISEEAFISAHEAQPDVVKISSILAAAGRSLPLIHSHELKFYSHLGAGANFKVNCEVYTKGDETSAPELVAVKYLRLPSVPGPETAKFYDGIMRELRVMTHPPFRYHECLLEPLAYGWSTSPETGVHPYLVVDYSDHGTLAQYLQRITPPVDECRQFALDVAVGLQALHHTRIVHGDLKPDNVLIYNCAGERPQVAKLADFGASIFEDDLEEGPVSYKGTSRYKAPEHAGRLGIPVYKAAQTMKGYYKADIYSIGLSIWEVMNNGDDYCESEWLLEGESELRFLDRICEIEKDGLLNRARLFCENRFRDLGQPVVQKTVMETFEVTLRDQAALRADIDTLVEKLANGIRYVTNPSCYWHTFSTLLCSKTRPKPAYPRIRSLPLSKDDGPDPRGWKLPIIRTTAPMDRRARKQQRSSGASLSASKSDHTINVFEESERIVRARQKPTFKLTTAKPSGLTESPSEVKGLSSLLQREPAPTATAFGRQSFNVFQVRHIRV